MKFDADRVATPLTTRANIAQSQAKERKNMGYTFGGKYPRQTTILLSYEDYETISRIAKKSGKSVGKVIREIVEEKLNDHR